MEEFVNRTPDEYYDWLRGTEIEVPSVEINELVKLTKLFPNKNIFVDTSIPMEILNLISNYYHIVVMLSDQSLSVDKFFEGMIMKNK